jgi:hypothetical protein
MTKGHLGAKKQLVLITLLRRFILNLSVACREAALPLVFGVLA